MSDAVIEAEHLSKSYLIGHQGRGRGGYVALRDVIAGGARNFARKAGDFFAGRQIVQGDEVEEFWALKDVSFTVKRGEVLGIIGRNGAGKSTLLKILSRITEPTAGRVTIRGRVASLLEVGTGFHPELTGRENIYLNGAILGMTRAEIRRKFDDIVAFAEVEQFLDTPVKRYSSGMYVRLAFAVAAHLEPEILLVDEVLAVGDAEFQKKCLGRLNEVAGDGRAVLFVSHNLDALRRTCESGVVLSQGRIAQQGSIAECIESYLGLMNPVLESRLSFPRGAEDRYHIIDIEILDDRLEPISCPATWEPVVFSIRFHSPVATPNGAISFQISTMDGFLITFCGTRPDQDFDISFGAGENVVRIRFDSLALSAGKYVVGAGLAIANTKWLCNEPHGAVMEVAARDVYNAGFSPVIERYPVPMQCRWERA
jgi:lipopolysaccharide transport system ATP-binding protein